MTRKKVYMIIESVLCALTAGLLAAAAIRMYVRGTAMQASDGLFRYIYTREKVGAALLNLLPLIAVTAVFTAAGWILGISGETADRPAAADGMDIKQSVKTQKTGRKELILRVVILLLAVLLIGLGIRNGGMADVFAKGAAVCAECIGLG